MTHISAEGTTAQGDRDATLRLIDWFSIERVRAANVLVVGAGAIGNEVLKNLALLGVGNIFIIDKDTIELSNLTRSVLYRETDCGRPKAEVAARALRALNPVVRARWKTGDLRFDLGRGLLRRMDVIVAGLDNVLARQELNTLCFNAGRPWVDAGIDVLDGHVCVYSPYEGACYECHLTEGARRHIQRSCQVIARGMEEEGKLATTPTIASIVAGVQVQEALKLLHIENWRGKTLVSRKYQFNGSVGESMVLNLVRRKDCVRPHSRIDPDAIKELKGASAHTTTVRELLDLTEELCRAPVSINLNFNLAVEMPCRCGHQRLIMRPLAQLVPKDLKCAKCGWQPERPQAIRVQSPHLHRGLVEQYPDALGNARLIDIGVPPLEVMRVHMGEPFAARPRRGRKSKAAAATPAEQREIFVELTGDLLRPSLGFHED